MSRSGGTERMTALLANGLARTHQVFILSLRCGGEVFYALDDGVEHRFLPAAKGKLGILRQIAAIRRFAREQKIDRIINVDMGMGIYGIPAAWGTGTRVVTWEHGNYFNNWGSRLFPYFRRFAARHSGAVVVLTKKDRENYLDHIRRCRPVHVIPNPAEPREFAYDPASKTILSAGLLLPIKGYGRVVELAKRLLPQRPGWTWIICGEGPERECLEREIAAEGLQDRVLLPGTVREMDRQYQSAAMFVLTSEMEGLPMVLLEAKAWGLPLVSFDIMTGPGDIIADGVNGRLVPAYDLDAMEESLARLMDDPALRQAFSRRSQEGMENFAWDNILKKWQEVLEK